MESAIGIRPKQELKKLDELKRRNLHNTGAVLGVAVQHRTKNNILLLKPETLSCQLGEVPLGRMNGWPNGVVNQRRLLCPTIASPMPVSRVCYVWFFQPRPTVCSRPSSEPLSPNVMPSKYVCLMARFPCLLHPINRVGTSREVPRSQGYTERIVKMLSV